MSAPHTEPGDSPLLDSVDAALRAGPGPFLTSVSTIVSHTSTPSDTDADALLLSDLVASIEDDPSAPAVALLHGLREFTADAALRARIDRRLAGRGADLPVWVRELRDTTITDVLRTCDPQGPGQHIIIGFAVPGADPISMSVHLDEAIIDAYPSPHTPTAMLAALADFAAKRGVAPPPYSRLDDPAQLRTLLDAALLITPEMGDIGPGASAWPRSRPWVQWLNRLLVES